MLELRHIYFMSSWSFNIMGTETSLLRQQSEEYNSKLMPPPKTRPRPRPRPRSAENIMNKMPPTKSNLLLRYC